MRIWVLLTWALAPFGCNGDEGTTAPTLPETCDAEELKARLASASSGETVRVGPCRLTGAFELPSGVTLAGRNSSESVLAGEPAASVLVVATGGASPSRVVDLAVENDGGAGLRLRGEGAAEVERVAVRTYRGAGIRADGLASVRLTSVTAAGWVDDTNAHTILPIASRDDAPTHGVSLQGVGSVIMRDVRVEGYATAGVEVRADSLEWIGGGVSVSRGIGVHLTGGVNRLEAIELRQILRFTALQYAAVMADAIVDTRGLVVERASGYGIVQAGGTARHEGLVASTVGSAAVWAQPTDDGAATLSIAGGDIRDATVAGVVVLRSPGAELSDVTVANTQPGAPPDRPPAGSVMIGDGIHLVDSVRGARLRRLRLDRNDRAGLVLATGADAIDAAELADVEVTGEGDQLGCIAQTAERIVPPGEGGWDAGITRDSVTMTNDIALRVPLEVTGIVMPCSIPPPDTLGAL